MFVISPVGRLRLGVSNCGSTPAWEKKCLQDLIWTDKSGNVDMVLSSQKLGEGRLWCTLAWDKKKDSISKIRQAKRVGGIVHGVECMLNKHEALNSSTSSSKKVYIIYYTFNAGKY
jgi:hypothetical protein